MEEATEICKLRLFLKLVAQMEPQPKKENFGLEPLPDIDFNVRAGNTLVGFASLDEVRKAIKQDGDQLKLDLQDDASRIDEKAELADRAFQRFRQMQTEFGMDAGDFRMAKKELRRRLTELNDELNHYLAREYGVDVNKPAAFEKWRNSHQPFHWLVEFYSIIDRGGFDVIIGNPPYVEYTKIKSEYTILEQKYTTLPCGNIYAPVIQQCISIMDNYSRMGMIVQLSAVCTDRMLVLQELYLQQSSHLWISCYDDRPGKLFDGLEHIRATILINCKNCFIPSTVYSTQLMRWYTEERSALFPLISFEDISGLQISGSIPKINDKELKSLIQKVKTFKETLESLYDPQSKNIIFYYRSPLYWIRSMNFLPSFSSASANRSIHHFKNFGMVNQCFSSVIGSTINSTFFYIWFIVYGNGINVALRDILTIPVPETLIQESSSLELRELFDSLMADFEKNSVMKVRRDGVEYQEFYPAKSKHIIYEIDRVLARHYGFTEEELDFIINYDIKYRMGRDSGGDD